MDKPLYGKNNTLKFITLVVLFCCSTLASAKVVMTLSQPEGALDERIKITIDAEQRQDVKQPDFSRLEQDFTILSQGKQSSASFKNGYTLYKNRWTLRLQPKTTGEITIQGIMVGSERARPITYKVFEPAEAPPPAAVRVQTYMESTQGYTLSAFILTTQVSYALDLVEAGLQEPAIENALIFRLGEQAQGEIEFRGVNYQTIEQRYLVFPQAEGEFQLPSLEFTATDSAGNSIYAVSNPLYFDAVQAPAEPWLPASELRIEEHWGQPLDDLQVGDTLKRQLIIEAHNFPDEWLPEIKMPTVEGISVYLHGVKTTHDASSGVLVSRKVFDYELLLTRAGPHRLPAVKIPWWDMVRDEQEVSELPFKEIQVNQFAIRPAPATNPNINAQSKMTTSSTEVQDDSAQAMSWHAWLWAFIAVVCATGWSLSYARVKQLQNKLLIAQSAPQPTPEITSLATAENDQQLEETTAFNQLARSCSRNQPNACQQYLLEWAKTLWPSSTIIDLEDILANANDPTLGYLLKDLEYHIYHPDDEEPWQGDILLRQLEKIRARHQRYLRQ